jgi:hypothetical protein
MSIKIFKCSPKLSLSEYCNYCHNNTCKIFSTHRITPVALYISVIRPSPEILVLCTANYLYLS